MSAFKKIIPVIFCTAVLVFVVFKTQPPGSLITANPLQMTLFFIPLFLLLAFLSNLFFKFYLKSIILSLGIILLLILQTLDILNLISFILTILAIGFIIRSFKKPKKINYPTNIPRLSHLEKQK